MSSTTKFARQVLTIAESLLTLSSLKHRISDSLVKAPAERDIEVCRGSDEQALDAEQLRLVLSENSNSRIPLRHLSKLLFRNNRTLTPIEICQYLELEYRHCKVSGIILQQIVHTPEFAQAVGLQCETLTLFEQLKTDTRKYVDSIFGAIDVNDMGVIDACDLVRFVKVTLKCTMSSKSARQIIVLIKDSKEGGEVNRDEFKNYFSGGLGGIRSNRPQSTEKRLATNESTQSFGKVKKCRKEIPEEHFHTENNSGFASNFTKNYLSNRKSLSKLVTLETQQYRAPKPGSIKAHKVNRLWGHPHNSHYQEYNTPLLVDSCNRTSLQRTGRLKENKQPYQAYINNKKSYKNKEDLISNLNQLSQLLNSRLESISNICSFPQFNLFNAFNILDCYDLGGINYGYFCRQLDSLGVLVSEQSKRGFWGQFGKEGLNFQGFTRLFDLGQNTSCLQDLKLRQPALKKLDGVSFWKKDLQIAYKSFLRSVIANVSNVQTTKQVILQILNNPERSVCLFQSPSSNITREEFAHLVGSDSQTLFTVITQRVGVMTKQGLRRFLAAH